MKSKANQEEPSIKAAQALARLLNEDPKAASRPAAELAQQFDLDPDFVNEILKDISRSPDAEVKPIDLGWLRRIGRTIVHLLDLMTSRPVFFVSALSVAVCAIFTLGRVQQLWLPSIFVSGVVLQMACYYRHAFVRTALYGTLAVWLIFASTYVVNRWRTETESLTPSMLAEFAAMGLVVMIFGVVYAAMASFFAVLGGYVRIRREELAEEALTRQQLLERLFDIQEKLKSSHRFQAKPKNFIPQTFVDRFNRHPFAIAIGGMIFLTLLKMLLNLLAVVRFAPNPPPPAASGLLVQIPTLLLTILYITTIAYLSGNIKRALSVTMSAFAFSAVIGGLHPGASGFSYAFQPNELYSQFVWVIGLTGFGSLWSLVEDRTLRSKRLMESDPAALVAEMVRLERKLKLNASDVCVLVVDVAKSADMKAKSDPLVAEYSFREYQNFLADVCHRHGGKVNSTAGDGAVMAFHRCDEAMAAAREIQTDIGQFNNDINRMSTEFRLRVGLHRGPVTGDIRDVQFTEVIDIAAHIQAAAPIRGILMSKPVAESLLGEHLIPLKEPVDGYEVFLAHNPTEEE